MKEFSKDRTFITTVAIGLFVIGLSFLFEYRIINPNDEEVSTVTPKDIPAANPSSGGLPTLTAQAFGTYYFNPATGKVKTLIEQSATTSLPIASITKLITGIVAQAKIPAQTPVQISFEAYNQYERNGGIELDKTYTAENLVKASLIESSNDAAYALAEHYGLSAFVREMNDTVKKFGANQTKFVNPTGVDERTSENRSTIRDLSIITIGTLTNPSSLEQFYPILRTATSTISAIDGSAVYTLKSTDQLITRKDFPLEIVGGKTGETPRAKQTLLLVTKSPDNGFLISIVLNSKDRFGDMTELTTWVKNSYLWQ